MYSRKWIKPVIVVISLVLAVLMLATCILSAFY